MRNEWQSPSGLRDSYCGVCLWVPNEDWFTGLHCSIDTDYNKWGCERGGRPVVSGDFVAAMLSVNPYFPDASASLLARPRYLMKAKSRSVEMPWRDSAILIWIKVWFSASLGSLLKKSLFKMLDKWLLISMTSMPSLGVYRGKWNDSSGRINTGSGTFSSAVWLGEATIRDFRPL